MDALIPLVGVQVDEVVHLADARKAQADDLIVEPCEAELEE